MALKEVRPYGAWRSPITADMVVAGTMQLEQVAVDGQDIYWTEGRPWESGRVVLCRMTAGGQVEDLTPPPFNVRTRVHEYGGGAFSVFDGVVFFSNFSDQMVYRLDLNEDPRSQPRPITSTPGMRYADATLDRPRNRLICVREDHTVPGREAVNTIVALDLEASEAGRVLVAGQVLVEGNDFYCSPRVSPDGSRLAWISWNHPNMP